MEGSTLVKSFRGIYELDIVEGVHKTIQKKRWNNLTLFNLNKVDSDEIFTEIKKNDIDRPLTPINESVLAAPETYNQLTRFIQQRIKPRSFWSHISTSDQHNVGEVLLAEVNVIWTEFQKQIDDPFLTRKQNKELRRRMAVYIITVCEQLFLYFCEHLKVLNSRDVFSKDANMSRICGQVAITAGKCLNLLKVRRFVIEDLRQDEDSDPLRIFRRLNPISPKNLKISLQNSSQLYRNFIKTPKSRKVLSNFNLRRELQDLKKQMPSINFSQANSLVDFHPKHKHVLKKTDKLIEEKTLSYEDQPQHEVQRKMKKWNSEPMLSSRQSFANKEMNEEDEDYPIFLPDQSDLNIDQILSGSRLKEDFVRSSSFSKAIELNVLSTTPAKTPEPVKDLDNLMRMQSKNDPNVDGTAEEGIPSLIRVITRYQSQNTKMNELRSEELLLTSRENKRNEEERIPLPPPKYPQPPFNQTKVPAYVNSFNHNDVTIRSSDVHLPHNVELPPLALEINQPLYNDLTGDVSPSTVKDLDANLFQDKDLKEVYSEIMKTVSDDHLLFDNDDSIIKPVGVSNVKKFFASTTLIQPPSVRLINPDLKVERLSQGWPVRPQSFLELLNKTTSIKSEEKASVTSSHARVVAESPAKTIADHASWMAWWKATVNTDDYFKYLSTKDTDFLGVIYHFYDSETSGSELGAEEKQALLEEKRKIEAFIEEVKKRKKEFAPGLWNVNVVRLGGLGNYPVFTDEARNVILQDLSAEEICNIGKLISCPGYGKSESRDSIEAVDSTVESEKSNLKLLNSNKIILSNLQRKKRPLDEQSSGYVSCDSASSSVFQTDERKQQLYYINSNKLLKQQRRSEKQKAIEQESKYGGISGVPSIEETAPSLPGIELQVTKTLQARFDAVWQKLRMTTTQRLNAAAKYSGDQYIQILDQIVSSWERVTDLIQKREKLLSDLQIFELDASDPQRHFHKGSKGSSTTRLKEATVRAKFYRQLEKIESTITPLLYSLYAEYGDIVSLEGRPYHEKMNSDKVEMLYWLQQERRAVQLSKLGEPKQLKEFMRDNHVTAIGDVGSSSQLPLAVSTIKINHET